MTTSTTTASLIIKVDATEATKGSEALDKLADSSGKAERATSKVNDT